MTLDHRVAAAAEDLRSNLERLDPPPFKPSRSTAPAALIVALLLGIGIVGYVVGTRPDDSGGISVATQPDVPDAQAPDLPLPLPVPSGQEDLDPAALGLDPDGLPAGQATAVSRWGTIASPEAGEFYMPIPAANAWSPDEAKIIVYRTGAGPVGHLVYDTFDLSAAPIELPFTPADIEQVYWHPLASEQLLFTNGADLMVFDLVTLQTTIEHRFDECDAVDSGVLPVAPAADGTLSLLCRTSGAVSQIVFDLSTGEQRSVPTVGDTAAAPSPSGDLFVRLNDDGSASVLDRSLTDTGVVLELGGNLFGFVTDQQGREWAVTTLFDGPIIGSAVLLPLDGDGESIVLIGPDRGDAYPPPGTSMSASGDKIVVSIRGEDDGLAGRITLLDLSGSFADPERRSIPHNSAGLHGYWSTAFVSVSPSGVIAYSTDDGSDRVNTIVGNFIEQVEPSD